MKKLSALFLVLAFICSSCKKNESNPPYHITCTIDGVDRTFNVRMLALQSTIPGASGIMIGGFETSTSTTASFGFEISSHPSDNPIVPATYTDAETNFEILSSYLTSSSGSGGSFEAGSTLFKNAVSSSITINNHLQVTITSMTNGILKGTFSGDFYLDAEATAAKKVITNGDFYLSLITTPSP